MSFRLRFFAGDLMVEYDMSGPYMFEAGVNLLLILLCVLVMLIFSAILTSSVSELAIVPLERMLASIASVAKSIGHYASEMLEAENEDEEDPEEFDDIEQSTEMAFLEK